MNAIKNRIKAHRRVRAGDLVPHELNFRTHPEEQKEALQARPGGEKKLVKRLTNFFCRA